MYKCSSNICPPNKSWKLEQAVGAAAEYTVDALTAYCHQT